MLKIGNQQTINFRFGFSQSGSYVDPLQEATPADVYASVVRGQNTVGNIIHPVTSLLNSSYRITNVTLVNYTNNELFVATIELENEGNYIEQYLSVGDTVVIYGIGGNYDGECEVVELIDNYTVKISGLSSVEPDLDSFDSSKYYNRLTKKSDFYFKRVSSSEYQFVYTVPEDLSGGIYTAIIQTTLNQRPQIIEHNFEVSNQKLLKAGSLIYKKVLNNTVTLTTDYAHNLSVGDLVSITETSNEIDGSWYVSDIPRNDQFSFELYRSIDEGEFDINGSYIVNQTTGISGILSGPTSGTAVSRKPVYDFLQPNTTNSILLLGHCDGLELNEITQIHSMQEAVNVLGADMNSPLLRGVYDAFSCGARDIYVAAVAPMSEYVDDISKRLTTMDFLYSSEEGRNLNFYEKYYERLNTTYDLIKGYELLDIVVPLETSIIGTGDVDFITQLAVYCYSFNATTGYVQLGIIGSRSNGMSDSDILILESNPIFKNKLTTYDSNGLIETDIGRYIIPIYGELTFSHLGFNKSYTSSAAAAYAGSMSSNPVYNGMIRKRMTGPYSLFGANLTKDSFARLDNLRINTVYRSRKAMRGYPYETYISNDYTLANETSSFTKAPQMRLVAMVINEIKTIGNDNLGKNSEDRISIQVKTMLDILLKTRAIKDYKLQTYASKTERGFLIFEIELVSSLGLKNISFSVTTGPGA